MRDARQLSRYGINVSEPMLDYPLLLARVREVVPTSGRFPLSASRSIL
jgi:hypothetical protein